MLSAAWLQKLGEMVPRAASGAWQSVQVSLGENEGNLTVQARRDEDRVQVAIRFTDPTLRALATEHADRLQSTLEARYGADVDLSFGAGGQDSEAADDDGPRFHPSPRTAGDTAEPAPTPTAAPRSGGAREWVG